MAKLRLHQLFHQNRWYFFGWMLWILVGSIFLINVQKGDFLLFFDKNRLPELDLLFKYGTRLGEEISYAILTLFFVFKKKYWQAALFPLTGLVVTIISNLTKSFFLRPRPKVYYTELGEFDLLTPIEGVYIVGGLTSFPSGHTMSAFALFTLAALLFPLKRGLALLFLAIAILVGISRIYLLQHFLEDVYLGSVIGTMLGFAIYLGAIKLNLFDQHPSTTV